MTLSGPAIGEVECPLPKLASSVPSSQGSSQEIHHTTVASIEAMAPISARYHPLPAPQSVPQKLEQGVEPPNGPALQRVPGFAECNWSGRLTVK